MRFSKSADFDPIAGRWCVWGTFPKLFIHSLTLTTLSLGGSTREVVQMLGKHSSLEARGLLVLGEFPMSNIYIVLNWRLHLKIAPTVKRKSSSFVD